MIRIGDIEIHFGAAGRRTGFFVKRDGWSGWDDSPTIRSKSTPRDGDGNFDLPHVFGERVLSAEVWAVADTDVNLDEMQQRFVRLALGRRKVSVDLRGSRTQWAYGRAADTLSFTDTGYRRGFAYASAHAQFTFADPFKYGETRTFQITEPATHEGTVPASPVYTVDGPRPSGYTIVGPNGRRYVVTQALPAGSTHQIDMRTGVLRLNGAPQSRAVGRAETWALPSAKRTLTSIEGAGSGACRVSLTDTFL